MLQARRLASCCCSLALLAACASPAADYPTLAIREEERWTGTFEVDPAPPPPAPTAPATLNELESLAEQARAAHAEFLAAIPEARNRAIAARGAGVGSNAWSVAQVAIADLESQRSMAMIALADLDRLYVDSSTAGEQTAAVVGVRAEITGLVEQENTLISDLLATIGP